jgi:DNA-3-methyladenine glycosylase II
MSFDKACRKLARSNTDFSALKERHGKLEFQPMHMRSPFESLVRAIAHQQLHRTAAEAILGRLILKFGAKIFPSAQDLVDLPQDEFRLCGFSGNKTRALKDIAQKTLDGVVPTGEAIVSMSDDEIVERLTQIYGVGRWTVEMLLIFQLGRLDIWPVDDFGVKKGFQIFKRKRQMPIKKHLHAYGEMWQPYRTVAALYFWKEANLAQEMKKTKPKVKKRSEKKGPVKLVTHKKVKRSRSR